MGFKMYVVRKCAECGRFTEYHCDACGKYICDDHSVYKQVRRSPKYFIFCKECAKKQKKPVDPHRHFSDAGIRDLKPYD